MKLAVIGSRTFEDRERLYEILDKNLHNIEMIVSGGANGADSLAQEWAQERGVPYLIFPARWYDLNGVYDKGAGFRRNRKIIDACDKVLAFHDGVSKGTLHSLGMAKEKNKPVKIILFVPVPKNKPVKKTPPTPSIINMDEDVPF